MNPLEHRRPEELFGAEALGSERALKRAYASLAKRFKPESHPAEFAHVHALYEQARRQLAWRVPAGGPGQATGEPAPPASPPLRAEAPDAPEAAPGPPAGGAAGDDAPARPPAAAPGPAPEAAEAPVGEREAPQVAAPPEPDVAAALALARRGEGEAALDALRRLAARGDRPAARWALLLHEALDPDGTGPWLVSLVALAGESLPLSLALEWVQADPERALDPQLDALAGALSHPQSVASLAIARAAALSGSAHEDRCVPLLEQALARVPPASGDQGQSLARVLLANHAGVLRGPARERARALLDDAGFRIDLDSHARWSAALDIAEALEAAEGDPDVGPTLRALLSCSEHLRPPRVAWLACDLVDEGVDVAALDARLTLRHPALRAALGRRLDEVTGDAAALARWLHQHRAPAVPSHVAEGLARAAAHARAHPSPRPAAARARDLPAAAVGLASAALLALGGALYHDLTATLGLGLGLGALALALPAPPRRLLELAAPLLLLLLAGALGALTTLDGAPAFVAAAAALALSALSALRDRLPHPDLTRTLEASLRARYLEANGPMGVGYLAAWLLTYVEPNGTHAAQVLLLVLVYMGFAALRGRVRQGRPPSLWRQLPPLAVALSGLSWLGLKLDAVGLVLWPPGLLLCATLDLASRRAALAEGLPPWQRAWLHARPLPHAAFQDAHRRLRAAFGLASWELRALGEQDRFLDLIPALEEPFERPLDPLSAWSTEHLRRAAHLRTRP